VNNAAGATIKGGLLSGTANGDGVDVDGIITMENYGDILGLGAKGIGSDTLPNNARAISIGGGTIHNCSTGQIIGSTLTADAPNGDSSRAGEGILSDNSSGGSAIAVTNITNDGVIHGKSGAAIQTGDGDDTVTNRGAITGDNGTAIALEAGNDTLNIEGSSASITGNIDGGSGMNSIYIKAVPEPATWAMLLSGGMVLLFALRRRRRAQA